MDYTLFGKIIIIVAFICVLAGGVIANKKISQTLMFIGAVLFLTDIAYIGYKTYELKHAPPSDTIFKAP